MGGESPERYTSTRSGTVRFVVASIHSRFDGRLGINIEKYIVLCFFHIAAIEPQCHPEHHDIDHPSSVTGFLLQASTHSMPIRQQGTVHEVERVSSSFLMKGCVCEYE